MGGKALKKFSINTVRNNTVEHEKIAQELKPRIEKLLDTDVRFIKYFRTKETHGDLDVLIRNHGQLTDVRQKIETEFDTKFIINNGGVYTFPYKNYQIDIIPQPVRNWEFAPYFFSWDPVGNLTGKLAHVLGLKFGFAGLVYPFRNFSGKLSTDIKISQDPIKIFTFLDLDFERYLLGFDTKVEIFNFITKSKYFNVKNFLFENLNHIDRKRNKKRKTYNEFLEWANVQGFEERTFSKDKKVFLKLINDYFPESELLVKLEDLMVKDNEMKLISVKFNGRLIMIQHPELTGKLLGHYIKTFKESIENFNQFVLDNSSEHVMKEFKKSYENNKK